MYSARMVSSSLSLGSSSSSSNCLERRGGRESRSSSKRLNADNYHTADCLCLRMAVASEQTTALCRSMVQCCTAAAHPCDALGGWRPPKPGRSSKDARPGPGLDRRRCAGTGGRPDDAPAAGLERRG